MTPWHLFCVAIGLILGTLAPLPPSRRAAELPAKTAKPPVDFAGF